MIRPTALLLAAALGATLATARADPAIDRLGLEVQRTQALRDVKRVQIAYSQFAEFGLWTDMADLFTPDAEWIDGATILRGQAAIARHLRTDLGGNQPGLPVGSLHTELFMTPVVTLDPDGTHAHGRWQELSLLGRYPGAATWSGGMEENDYALHAGTWKIARIHHFPQLAGPYETGFFAVSHDLPFIPYHYTPGQAGAPIPPIPAAITPAPGHFPAIAEHIAALTDEDTIRNLQNIYGYYVDRKMWSDVVDLFAPDGALEIGGIGIYRGPASIRRALEADGPEPLAMGQVNDHIEMNAIVTVAANGTARARGLELGMLTPKLGQAYWSVAIFENSYVKSGGLWRIREMRVFPRMKADYYQGWGKSRIVDPPPPPPYAPDEPSRSASPQTGLAIPVFAFPNPATGRPVRLPPGAIAVGADSLLPPSARASIPPLPSLAEAARQLAVAQARDAVDNLSSAYGYYLNDYQWQPYVELFAKAGRREKACCGFYIGRDRIFKVEALSYGPMPVPRDWVRLHTRLQPVIDVARDAKSAYLRTRMLLYFANSSHPGAFNSGMYPNEAAVLEDGAWKLKVGGGIDEPYFISPSYAQGWARPTPGATIDQALAAASPLGARGLVQPGPRLELPADIPIAAMGARGEGFAHELPNYTIWPQLKPMWFHYRNPVSGRIPPHYCPDVTTCIPLTPVAKASP